MKVHYRKYLVDWLEGRLSADKKEEIESHLKTCSSCRTYYSKMQELLDTPPEGILPELEPQPYEITKIQSLALKDDSEQHSVFSLFPFKMAFIYSIALIFTLLTGFWMGKDLVQKSSSSELYSSIEQEQSFITLSSAGFEDLWESFTGELNNEN